MTRRITRIARLLAVPVLLAIGLVSAPGAFEPPSGGRGLECA